MEKEIKYEIIKMSIPMIGVWWILNRVLSLGSKVSWWDVSEYRLHIILGLALYQAICWISYKMFYELYLIPMFNQ